MPWILSLHDGSNTQTNWVTLNEVASQVCDKQSTISSDDWLFFCSIAVTRYSLELPSNVHILSEYISPNEWLRNIEEPFSAIIIWHCRFFFFKNCKTLSKTTDDERGGEIKAKDVEKSFTLSKRPDIVVRIWIKMELKDETGHFCDGLLHHVQYIFEHVQCPAAKTSNKSHLIDFKVSKSNAKMKFDRLAIHLPRKHIGTASNISIIARSHCFSFSVLANDTNDEASDEKWCDFLCCDRRKQQQQQHEKKAAISH